TLIVPSTRSQSVSWRIAAAAIGGAGVGFVVGLVRSGALEGLALALLFAVLAVASAVDLRERRIPNALTYPGIVVALVLAASGGEIMPALGGLLLAGGGMALFWIAGRGQLGLGDVKLSALVGAALGIQATPAYLLAGGGIGAVVAAAVLLVR